MKKSFSIGAVCLALLSHAMQIPAAATEAITPLDLNSRPLNLDFETGTLKDWIAEGDAFEKQPIRGDTVATRRTDMKSQHQGSFWIGTY